MRRLELERVINFAGEVKVPGSKSIANRAILLAALAKGETELRGLPDSDDVIALLRALPGIGIKFRVQGDSHFIQGAGGPFKITSANLNLENAGTALRPIIALLCASHGGFTIDGNSQMQHRPIGDLVRGLKQLGVTIAGTERTISGKTDLFPPVHIQANGLAGGKCTVSGNVSSQFISALLMAGPLCENPLLLEIPEEPVSKPYIDITIGIMKHFGANVRRHGYTSYEVDPGEYLSPLVYNIEPDATAATYFMAMGALAGPVRVMLPKNSLQGDVRFSSVLESMGAIVTADDESITVSAGETLRGIDIDMNDMPDAAMTLAVLALFANGPTTIRNVANLRVKESERLSGLAKELRKLGAKVEEGPDSLRIEPPATVSYAEIETYKDHRMAMAFSLAAFGSRITIIDPECVSKTYPAYFTDFATVAGPDIAR